MQRGVDLVDQAFQAALELALDAGTGLQQAHIQGQQTHAPEHLWHLRAHDSQGQALDYRGFSDSRLAHQNGVVLAPPRKGIDHLPDFVIATEYGVEFSVTSLASQVMSKALQ